MYSQVYISISLIVKSFSIMMFAILRSRWATFCYKDAGMLWRCCWELFKLIIFWFDSHSMYVPLSQVLSRTHRLLLRIIRCCRWICFWGDSGRRFQLLLDSVLIWGWICRWTINWIRRLVMRRVHGLAFSNGEFWQFSTF